MLEKLPEAIGEALRDRRAGLEKIAYSRIKLRTGTEPIRVASEAFDNYQPIPVRHTADGDGVSPPLQWSDIPDGASSLILIVEDPDAPTPQPFVHAIVVGLPACDGSLHEGELQVAEHDTARLKLGRNSYLQAKWLPPDPPRGHGVHHYAFQLFALKDARQFSVSPDRDEIEDALQRSAIAAGCLIGTYERRFGGRG